MDAIPGLARIAALMGDPTRSLILYCLMDGRALTVSELAGAAGVTLQTSSGHLSQLEHASLVRAERQGRHRYYRLAGAEVAHVLEGLMALAQRNPPSRVAVGPGQAALRHARVCYDHLAGEMGVMVLEVLRERGHLGGSDGLQVTAAGGRFFEAFGIPLSTLRQGRRPLCRACLDWSERRHHLAGALGAALLARWIELRWLSRSADRTVRLTPRGRAGFAAELASVPSSVGLPGRD